MTQMIDTHVLPTGPGPTPSELLDGARPVGSTMIPGEVIGLMVRLEQLDRTRRDHWMQLLQIFGISEEELDDSRGLEEYSTSVTHSSVVPEEDIRVVRLQFQLGETRRQLREAHDEIQRLRDRHEQETIRLKRQIEGLSEVGAGCSLERTSPSVDQRIRAYREDMRDGGHHRRLIESALGGLLGRGGRR